MEYNEFIDRALNGQSVNSMAKRWGVHQPTLDRYTKGDGLPGYDLALKMIRDSGMNAEEALEALATEERNRKARAFKLKKQGGFVQTDLLFILGGGWVVSCILYIMSNEGAGYWQR